MKDKKILKELLKDDKMKEKLRDHFLKNPEDLQKIKDLLNNLKELQSK
tara:strand:+ start:272 stop:415 length:144 start_codon:yes stop_codon:yes gene_type:complete